LRLTVGAQEEWERVTASHIDAVLVDNGFPMKFSAKLLPIELNLDSLRSQ
jgi:hypothetical protein